MVVCSFGWSLWPIARACTVVGIVTRWKYNFVVQTNISEGNLYDKNKIVSQPYPAFNNTIPHIQLGQDMLCKNNEP